MPPGGFGTLVVIKMKTNFEIDDNHAVSYKGHHIDLHNDFDFTGVTEATIEPEITLEFKKSNGDWVRNDGFAQLMFRFKNVNYKYFGEGELTDHPEDSKCIGGITFFPSAIRDISNGLTYQKVPNENDDLVFTFEDGRIIRVNCEEVELIVIDKNNH